MAQLIDKAAVVAELERRIKEGEAVIENVPSSAIMGLIQAYKNILSFLDTLEVKEVDLEKATEQNLWKPADGDDLPDYDREVIVLIQPYPLEGSEFAVSFAHRPNPNGWNGKSVTTGEMKHYTPKTYDKGGWNSPNVKYWLDCSMPKVPCIEMVE